MSRAIAHTPDPDAEREIARMILQYLTAHPDAKDTLDGIAQWWLRRGWGETPGGGIERAVASLCAQGLILETRRRGLPPLYRLNPRRRTAVAKILGSMTRQGCRTARGR
jgi:hypothetical protein